MPARRIAQRSNAFGVKVILCGMSANPAHGLLRIINLRGVREIGQQAVIHGERDKPLFRQRGSKLCVLRFIAADPAAAMHHENAGAPAVEPLRLVDIQFQ